MFHEILVENKDCDVLCFLSRDNYIDPIEDYHINLHLFDNGDSPCIMNWTIKKNCSRPIWFHWTNFYQNHRELFLHGRFLQCLSIINRNQPFCKQYTIRTSPGNIVGPGNGYISYKIYTQISLTYQTRYPPSNKFYSSCIRIYCTNFDRTEIDHTTTLEKKNWLVHIATFRSYKTMAKMAKQSTRHTQYHFTQMVRINRHWHLITRFCWCFKNSIQSHMLYQT